jgi:hypothetical protein
MTQWFVPPIAVPAGFVILILVMALFRTLSVLERTKPVVKGDRPSRPRAACPVIVITRYRDEETLD